MGKQVSDIMVLFSREESLDEIRNAFCDGFGLPRLEGGNSVELGSQNCSVQLLILFPSMGGEEEEFIRKQKNLVCGYFAHVEEGDEDIKINLCHHIQRSKAFVSIVLEARNGRADLQRDIDAVTDVILTVMKKVDGVLVARQGTAALNQEGKVILSGDGATDLQSYFPFAPEENPGFLADCTDRQKARRNENMKYLFDRGIYVCELPVNEDDEKVSIRSKEEAVRRMLGVMVVSLYSEAMLNPEENLDVAEARKFIGRVLEDYAIESAFMENTSMKNTSMENASMEGASVENTSMKGTSMEGPFIWKPEEILTPKELAYIQDDNPDERTKIGYSWHYEHLYALEWVLGLADWNDPVEICDVGLMVRNVKAFGSIGEICEKTVMRSRKEILDKADLVYRMDWAAVDARIHGMTGPAGINHGVVQARHKTLNWMIGFCGAQWDDVDTPT